MTLTVHSVDELLDAMPHMLSYEPPKGSLSGIVVKDGRQGFFCIRDTKVVLLAALAFLDEHQPTNVVLWDDDDELGQILASAAEDIVVATDSEWWMPGQRRHAREVTRMDAEAVVAGVKLAAPTREERIATLTPAPRFSISPISDAWKPRWKYDEAAERRLLAMLQRPRPLAQQSIVAAMNNLDNIRMRDTLLWDIVTQSQELDELDLDVLRSRLIEVAADAPRKAPAYSILAAVCYMVGDGPLANEACRLALADDPDYRLATLLSMMMAQGTPPHTWMASVTSLSREACNGTY